ncbi:MAG: glutamate racemase [Candidatus Margulisiibacteriota bacterium]
MDAEILSVRKLAPEEIAFKPEGRLKTAKPVPNSPVGIFDSGVGGLTVLTEFTKKLPDEDVIYFADTAHVPYGSRPPEEILEINKKILDYFISRGVKMVIMACGTSSAIAYPVLKDKYNIPIIAMIEPGARAALQATRNKKIGVIATLGTVNSGAFQNKIKEFDKEAKVFAEACPLFVPLIEGGFIEADETKKLARQYLKPLLKEGIDTLVLGCTHYPHLRSMIGEIAGSGVTLVDPASQAAHDAKKILSDRAMLNSKGAKPKYEYISTSSPLQFQDLGSRLLGRPIPGVKLLKL